MCATFRSGYRSTQEIYTFLLNVKDNIRQYVKYFPKNFLKCHPYTPAKERQTPTYMKSGDFFIIERELFDDIRMKRGRSSGNRFWTLLKNKYFPSIKNEKGKVLSLKG